jgi:hypothetical protein
VTHEPSSQPGRWGRFNINYYQGSLYNTGNHYYLGRILDGVKQHIALTRATNPAYANFSSNPTVGKINWADEDLQKIEEIIRNEFGRHPNQVRINEAIQAFYPGANGGGN